MSGPAGGSSSGGPVAGGLGAALPVAVHAAVLEVAPHKRPTVEAATRLVDDLGFHSLALLELAYLLEDEFELPPLDVETARGIVTVGDVVEHVRTALTERPD